MEVERWSTRGSSVAPVRSPKTTRTRPRTTNTGIPYELLVQEVFQEILDQKSARTIMVERDVKVKGKTTTHQIDVLWRFSVGGIEYTTVVQAKDWNSKINQAAVLAFRSVLDDIPGQPRGLMVTRLGFQAGALRVARANGIQLYVLRVARPHFVLTDVGYMMMRLDPLRRLLNTVIFEPTIRRLEFRGSGPGESRSIKARPRDMHLADESGASLGTVRDVVASVVNEMREARRLQESVHRSFAPGTYLTLRKHEPRYLVNGVDLDIEIQERPQEPIPFVSGVVQFILENLQTGETHTHMHSGKP